MKRIIYLMVFIVVGTLVIYAQKPTSEAEREYLNVLKQRSEKILDQYVNLPPGETREKVRDLMVKQYWDLNKVHDEKDVHIQELKRSGKKDLEKAIHKKEAKAEKKLLKLQKKYLRNLSKHLNVQQIDGVKEGMTLGAMNHNYRGFTEMIPSLKPEEKEHIRTQLLEARDKAMNLGSSEAKQAVFRQYKGKINNWLSERGYDLEKEGIEWRKRIQSSSNQY